jgi:hypothetical protein
LSLVFGFPTVPDMAQWFNAILNGVPEIFPEVDLVPLWIRERSLLKFSSATLNSSHDFDHFVGRHALSYFSHGVSV